jgi:UDP-N-acetylmuramoyl-tripeptide--D-alanyl-D-alanine ligase
MRVAELRLEDVARRTGGRLLGGSPSLLARGYVIDSRCAGPGDLFFAVVAGRDGHDFVSQAAANGASGAVVSKDVPRPDGGFGLILVPDTVRALQDLARSVLLDHPVTVVGITGSAGKTTTKEFAAEFLSSAFPVLKSEKNFNNHLGLALSLLKLEKGHRAAVLEMGMSAPGEIAALTRIAPPDVAVITNIRPVHLQFFEDMDGIARAKKEILDGAKPDGTAVLNGDDPLVARIAESWHGRKVTFGRSPGCDVRAVRVRRRGFEGLGFDLAYGRETAAVEVSFLIESVVEDFLAAAAAAYALSIPVGAVASRASFLKPPAMRGNLVSLGKGVRLLDDSYNSNPTALETALKSLALHTAGRRVAVLGDMLELGAKEREFHLEAGRTAALSGWDLLVTVGPLAALMADGAATAGMSRERIISFADSGEAARAVPTLVAAGDLVLVKGSRGMRMEKIVESLRERLGE